MPDVELSILAAPSDLAFLEPTLNHQLRCFASATQIAHRVLLLDERDAFAADVVGGLRRLAASFLGAGRIDEVRRVDWTPDVVAGAMARWYGDPWTPTDANGRARYQYVHTVESSTEPLVLHIDSDMLFHGDMGDWLDRVRSMFDRNDDMVAVVPNGVIPQATRRIEWLLGPRFDRPSWPSGWAGTDVTSRGVLLHRDRVIERALPLVRGAADEQWERSVQAAFQRAGLTVRCVVGDDIWMLHPHRHNHRHVQWLGELIAEVEAGGYPYRRWGHPWDITTEGWKFLPWVPPLFRRRLARRVREARASNRHGDCGNDKSVRAS